MVIKNDTPIKYLKGVGDARSIGFNKLGIFTAWELLCLFPARYENRGNVKKLFQIEDGETCSAIVSVTSDIASGKGKTGISYVKVCMSDTTGELYVTFFNNKWIAPTLTKGRLFRVFGKFFCGIYGRECVSPLLEPICADKKLESIVPIYPLVKELSQKTVVSAVKQVLPLTNEISENFPSVILDEFSLVSKSSAFNSIHFPCSEENKNSALRRLAFEELLVFQLALRLLKQEKQTKKARIIQLKDTKIKLFVDSLPFSLTSAQQRVTKEILADISKDSPMMRLVQGDVGSGKTIVAAIAIYLVAKNGGQAVMMAPTEILASQHYATFVKLFEKFDIKTELLVGSISAAKKSQIKDLIKSGKIDVIVGTSAVIQNDVEFFNLTLAITDEQHRFGVMQRASLSSGKVGDEAIFPHTLVMSATPIPRTLSFILCGDLDISIIDELPPGRQKVETFALDDSYRGRVNEFLSSEILAGHQAYVVCPLVEENEEIDRKSAEEHAKELKEIFPNTTTELLHGKMNGKKKQEIMDRFKSGDIQILISTTVVEVGVDVPNATLMIVENAECFGLSTLHQLRGRIGRGKSKSYCILMYDKRGKNAAARLETMCRTNDGFEIANVDLKLRGPGDYFGERQSGELKFKVASIADMELIEQTKLLTDRIIEKNSFNEPEYAMLFDETKKLFDKGNYNVIN
ncbi:MAG: ATP-dependent DNA helicase RecG [Clostridia bacterium]